MFALALLGFAQTAQAAAPYQCRNYAAAAVRQERINEAIPGCFNGASNRWNTNWSMHYNWCLSAYWPNAHSE